VGYTALLNECKDVPLMVWIHWWNYNYYMKLNGWHCAKGHNNPRASMSVKQQKFIYSLMYRYKQIIRVTNSIQHYCLIHALIKLIYAKLIIIKVMLKGVFLLIHLLP
jgi:hypothetical protein